ncbi:hypothetical protein G4B88_011697 [Cannabis sativa]|uniref:Reverse transcriptase zinc-binding domain-containing protein n=1 Tax=Cannabis sativa TaxID=3483 RepID=A0A7J6FRZ3_CANSA|nr:hypothetical protein G4B88_011697 [Cannabis sativa]
MPITSTPLSVTTPASYPISSDTTPVIPFPSYLPITPMIATYPPNSHSVKPPTRTPLMPATFPLNSPSFSTVVSLNVSPTLHSPLSNAKGKAILVSDDDFENVNPNKQFKRQLDSESLRNVLKRCRSNTLHIQSDSSAPSGNDNSLQVADLITQNRQWDLTTISANFGQADIDIILSIPLTIYPSDDILIWNGTNSGNYMVKSGYYFASSLAELNDAGSTFSSENWWTKFWKLKLPSKLRIFVSKVYHNVLPVAAELNRKHIAESPYCPLCKMQKESINHALFLCSRAKEVWCFFPHTLNFKLAATTTSEEFLLYVSANTSTPDFEQFLTLCWSIWFERNAEFHGKLPKQPAAIFTFATGYISNLDNKMVNSLMDIHETSWDISLVHDMFNPRDAHLILGISLSSIPNEDCWS